MWYLLLQFPISFSRLYYILDDGCDHIHSVLELHDQEQAGIKSILLLLLHPRNRLRNGVSCLSNDPVQNR